jgi:D-alanyl-D-alanine carboxypeptidase (penicillin-binding protein 5/6)
VPARARKSTIVVLAVLAAWLALPSTARAQDPGEDTGGVDTTAPGFIPNEPAAWILVDADTGAVLDGKDIRTPHLPGSTIKLLTSLMAIQRFLPGEPVPISEHAAGMPARKMNLLAGERWSMHDLLFSMLTVSANDAAVAVAERIGGGSLATYEALAERTAVNLGLTDAPDLSDPAGLDDEFSNGEGSRISPRDLAIIARAVLAEPELMAMIGAEEYRFTGGDGQPHRVDRRNRLFELYPGTIGMKTGLTERAGRCLVAAATRDGRTMLAVMFDAPDMYASAAILLDRGFATPVVNEPTDDRLPEVATGAALDPPEVIPGSLPVRFGVLVDPTPDRLGLHDPPVAVAVVLIGMFPALAIRRQMERRRWAGVRAAVAD